MRKIALFALAGALALSACGKKEETPEVESTNNLVAPPDENVVDATEEAEPEVANNVAEPAPPPKVSEDQQMLDDAAASGMTARLRQGGDGEPVEEKADSAESANAANPR